MAVLEYIYISAINVLCVRH